MLAPNLNRGMATGTDSVDENAHQDITGRSHGTNQGLMRVNGRDRETSQACLETQEGKAHENSLETLRENDKLTLEQLAQGIKDKNAQRKKDTTVFRLTKADENDDERVLAKKGGGS